MLHLLKTHPQPFTAVYYGYKKFEFRKNDRDFKADDQLILKEWDPMTQEYTGRKCLVQVTYILKNTEFGLPEGYCIMSIDLLHQIC